MLDEERWEARSRDPELISSLRRFATRTYIPLRSSGFGEAVSEE